MHEKHQAQSVAADKWHQYAALICVASKYGNPTVDAGHGYNPLTDQRILLDYEKPEPQALDKQCRALRGP
ncbi:hypothetical protein [Cupriavidus sp. TMH.W2]|uniref:hypothetical protein n=1 Tax=Cupriavidus sp. TMH.W2 TaxID=3434465 RepID=UPI003D76AAAB